MFSIASRWLLLLAITVRYLNAQVSIDENTNSVNIDTPSIPVHNDTSRDNEGADHDSEPMRNNGRGSFEANSQNYAAENNGVHGLPIEDFQKSVVDRHNLYRRQNCADDVESDEDLHRIAEERAHSEANGKKLPLPDDYNENVYEHDTGDPSRITGEMIVKSWYDQRQQYDVNNESSATDYTQLVWKTSRKVGVGHAYNGHKLYVIVVYKPSGNIRGEFAANVGCNANEQTNPATR